MKKSVFVSLLCAALLCAFVLPAMSAAKKEAPADQTIKWPGETKTKGEVMFSHKKHAAAKCEDCHHKLAEKADNYKCSTAGCHDDFKEKKGEKSLYGAYHVQTSKHSCMGCHKEAKAGGKNAPGPQCDGTCHPKKS